MIILVNGDSRRWRRGRVLTKLVGSGPIADPRVLLVLLIGKAPKATISLTVMDAINLPVAYLNQVVRSRNVPLTSFPRCGAAILGKLIHASPVLTRAATSCPRASF